MSVDIVQRHMPSRDNPQRCHSHKRSELDPVFSSYQLLPLFQIVGCFSKSRYIVFAIYLDIMYIQVHSTCNVSRNPKTSTIQNGGSSFYAESIIFQSLHSYSEVRAHYFRKLLSPHHYRTCSTCRIIRSFSYSFNIFTPDFKIPLAATNLCRC